MYYDNIHYNMEDGQPIIRVLIILVNDVSKQ